MRIADKIKYYRGFELDKGKYSIHTFEMAARLTPYQYNHLQEILLSYDHEQIRFDNNVETMDGENDCYTISTTYSVRKDTGISRFQLRCIKPLDICHLIFSCNARVLLQIDELPFVCIVEPDDIKRIYDRLQEVFDIMGVSSVVPIESFYFRRIDYCTNIRMDSVEAADIYMNLLSKGRALYNSEPMTTPYDGNTNRLVHPKSLNWKGKTFEMAIYEKYDMLEDQQIQYGYSMEEVAEAKNRIRFEVRLVGSAIVQMKRRLGKLSDEEFMNMSDWNSAEAISKKLVQMYGCGDFVPFQTAIDIINKSRCYQKTKEILLDFITELAKPNATIDSAYEAYIRSFRSRRKMELHEFMKHFNNLGISPITIPDGISGYPYFRNPVYYIDQRNANYE